MSRVLEDLRRFRTHGMDTTTVLGELVEHSGVLHRDACPEGTGGEVVVRTLEQLLDGAPRSTCDKCVSSMVFTSGQCRLRLSTWVKRGFRLEVEERLMREPVETLEELTEIVEASQRPGATMATDPNHEFNIPAFRPWSERLESGSRGALEQSVRRVDEVGHQELMAAFAESIEMPSRLRVPELGDIGTDLRDAVLRARADLASSEQWVLWSSGPRHLGVLGLVVETLYRVGPSLYHAPAAVAHWSRSSHGNRRSEQLVITDGPLTASVIETLRTLYRPNADDAYSGLADALAAARALES